VGSGASLNIERLAEAMQHHNLEHVPEAKAPIAP
jgi:hypothetical protein